MEIDNAPSPFTMAAKLLSEFGDAAPSKAINRCLVCATQNDCREAAFWCEVAVEAFHGLIAMTAINRDDSDRSEGGPILP
jgi:hypothetical protein